MLRTSEEFRFGDIMDKSKWQLEELMAKWRKSERAFERQFLKRTEEGKKPKEPEKPFFGAMEEVLNNLSLEACQSEYEKTIDNMKIYESISHAYDKGEFETHHNYSHFSILLTRFKDQNTTDEMIEIIQETHLMTSPVSKAIINLEKQESVNIENGVDIIESLRRFNEIEIDEEDNDETRDPEFLETFFGVLLSTRIFRNFDESMQKLAMRNKELVQRLSSLGQGVDTVEPTDLQRKLEFEHEQKVIKETTTHLEHKDRELGIDAEELEKYIEIEKRKLEDKQTSFGLKLKKTTKLELRTKILAKDKECYDEALGELNRKMTEIERENGDLSKEITSFDNKLSISSTEYYNMLKELQENRLQEESLKVRLKALEKFKEELASRYHEMQQKLKTKIREIEDEENRIKETEDNLELDPMKLQKVLKDKAMSLEKMKMEHLEKTTRVGVLRDELARLNTELDAETLEMKKINLTEMELQEKVDEYKQLLQEHLVKKSFREDLKQKYEFHALKIKELTEITKKEIEIEESEIKTALESDLLDQSYIQLEEISKGVREVESKIQEVLVKQEQINTVGQNNLKAMGIYSNFGSIATSNYDPGFETSEKSKDRENETGNNENLKKQITLIFEKIENLQNDLQPHMKAMTRFMMKNESVVETRFSRFFEKVEKKLKEKENISSEVSRIIKDDFKKIVEDVINSKSSSISERFSIKSSNTHTGTMIQKSPSSEPFSERIRARNFSQKNSDYYHIMQFMFKMSSVFVNTMADLIKDNRNYHYLREEIIK